MYYGHLFSSLTGKGSLLALSDSSSSYFEESDEASESEWPPASSGGCLFDIPSSEDDLDYVSIVDTPLDT